MSRIIAFLTVFVLGAVTASGMLTRYRIIDDELQLIPSLRLPDGSTYAGDLVDGQLSGRGELRWLNGAVYKGAFKDGLQHGEGSFWYADGTVYKGNFSTGQPHGQGRLFWVNGDFYEGNFHRGIISGQGKQVVKDYSSYEGGFVKGLYDGQGTLTYDTGDSYTGQFKKGEIDGEGEHSSEDLGTYKGLFVKGEFSGPGTHTDQEGVRNIGVFKNWLLTGEGKTIDTQGNEWTGEYEDGMLSGKGEYKGVDGSSYKGEFKYGQYEGEGTLIDAEGDKYTGQFSRGRKNGQGTYWPAEPEGDLKEIEGIWSSGEMVENHSDPEFLSRKDLVELALYSQDSLLAEQLSDLKPGEPDQIDLYFMGIAGHGAQEVFRKEVESIQNQFDEELGTVGRSVVLVNSRTTVENYPLATYTSIERALDQLQTVMNNEDILFVYMTSHGSQREGFSISQKGFALNSLSADKLKTLFDRKNMPWQVMTISACYSGALLMDLATDTRLIMTASAQDRKSFGCGDEDDFTYFGRAYFRESLTNQGQFVKAFERAKKLVREWEDKEDYQNSQPQIHKPDLILEHLKKWRMQMELKPELNEATNPARTRPIRTPE